MGPDLASLEFESLGRATVAQVRGEVDMSNADALRDELASHIGESPWFVLDLSACDYLDSAGLSVVARMYERCRARGTRMRVVVPAAASTVDRVFAITGMDGVLDVDRSLDDALAFTT